MKLQENHEITKLLSKEEYKALIQPLKKRLSTLSQEIGRHKIPVMLLIDGFGASGKGSLISELILNWDPRGFKTYSTEEPEPFETKRPWLYRFWMNIPEYGKIAVLDRSWYTCVTVDRVENDMDDAVFESMTRDINTFERQLTDDGYCIIKIFLRISRKEQKLRFERLLSSPDTSWRVTKQDIRQNEQYDLHDRAFNDAIERTDKDYAPWNVVDAEDYWLRNIKTFEIVADALEKAVERKIKRSEPMQYRGLSSGGYAMKPVKPLSRYDLTKSISGDGYKELLRQYQGELSSLHNLLYQKKIPVIVCYEGWDAAGKGGNIKRIARSLDARGYDVIPVSAPTKSELEHHYLWRFWRELPKVGNMAIFDRSWYGRVMVERIEGFCTEERWHQAYREINEFEEMLHNWGAVIIKFWLHIDKDEQLRRFRSREETEEKRWKLGEEDWRNRDKWEQYETAVDDMLRLTSTEFAPWHVIESNDKKYARIKTLRIIIESLRKVLSEE